MFPKLKQAHTKQESERARERVRERGGDSQRITASLPWGPEAQTQNLQLAGDASLFAQASSGAVERSSVGWGRAGAGVGLGAEATLQVAARV